MLTGPIMLLLLAVAMLPTLPAQMTGDAFGAFGGGVGDGQTPLGGDAGGASNMAGPADGGNGAGGGNGADGNGADGRGPGGGRLYGQRPIGGLTEKIEGCFDRFDSEYAVELGPENINNRRCQAICTARGYALSATGLVDSCFCGNDYPSSFHRVDTAQCDQPCSPDKSSCFAFTCCGSRDQNFFTVSWSGEMDVMKQLLRQLSHDYRFNSPTFQRKIEDHGFCDRVSLRLGPSPVQDGDEREELQEDGAERGAPPPPPLFLSVGDGCPVGWALFDCWCYKQHWAEPSTYDEAVAKCRAEPGSCGAELVTVTSEAENCFLRQMAGGCQGWLGYRAPPLHSSPSSSKALEELGYPNGGDAAAVTDSALSSTLDAAGLREKLAAWGRDQPAAASRPREGAKSVVVKTLEEGRRRRRPRWVQPRFEKWRGQHNRTAAANAVAAAADEGERILRTGIIGLLNTSLGLGLGGVEHHDNDTTTSRRRRPIAELAFNYLLRRAHRRETARLAQIVMEYDNVGIRSLRLLYAPPPGDEHTGVRVRRGDGRRHRRADPLAVAAGSDASTPRAMGRGQLKVAAVHLRPEEPLVGVKAVIGVLGIRALTWITKKGEGRKEVMHGPYGAHLLLDRPNLLVRQLRFHQGGEGNDDEEEVDRGVVGVFGHRDAATGYLRSLGFYERAPSNCAWMAGDGNWTIIDCAKPHFSKHAPPATSHYVCKKPGWSVRLGTCEDGWTPFGEACYLRQRAANKSWWGARRHCQALGGHLVSVASNTENQFVHALLGSRGGYIGYHRRTTAKPWRWDEYSNMNKAIAAAQGGGGVQGDKQEEEQCFELRGDDGTWRRTSCRVPQTRVVLCEVGAANSSCVCVQPRNATEEAAPEFWYGFGCSCYLRWVPGSTRLDDSNSSEMSWVEAQAYCGRRGGRLLTIKSREENEWARRLVAQSFTFNQGTMPAYIGLNNLMNGGDDYEWSYYENWQDKGKGKGKGKGKKADALHAATSTAGGGRQQGQAVIAADEHDRTVMAMCTQMDRNGSWVEVPCDEYGNPPKASCFVCKQPRAATYPALRPHADECWIFDVVNETTRGTDDPVPYPWCADCAEAYLQSDRSGQFLCADAQNWLYLSSARDPAWCLWTLLVHPDTGALVLLTRHNAALFYSAETGVLACRNLPPEVNTQARYDKGDHFHHWWHTHDPHGKEQEQQPPSPQPTPSPWDQPPSPDEDESPWEWEQSIFALDDVAVLYPSHPVEKLAWRHMRISILARSRDLEQPGLKECSLAIYDDSPHTNSYRCWRRPYSGADDLVYLEQEALLFFDQSTYATPRVPLPNGRVRCENQSPTETATCTFAYGQGLTLSRQFRINVGYTVSDVITHRVNVNPAQIALFRIPAPPRKEKKQHKQPPAKPPRTPWQQTMQEKREQRRDRLRQHLGGKNKTHTPQQLEGPDLTLSVSELKEFQNAFSVAFNNFYEILIVKSYVETRNWQLSVPVAPRTTDTIQFWLSAENLRYRWRALFAARGGFTITVWGQPIGDHHSLGDLSYFRDLFFFVFGTYEFPYEAEIIITVNDIPGDGWPLPLPEQSQGDRIRDVTRNGQLGFGYGPTRPFT